MLSAQTPTALPKINFRCQSITFVSQWTHIDMPLSTSQGQFTLVFTLGVVHPLGVDTCIVVCP
jgi:hypothetical protein